MQGVERVDRAENLHKRHAGQPLFLQQQPHQRRGAGRKPRHHRHHHEGAGLDGPPGHLPQGMDVVLLRREHRQQHAVERGVDAGCDLIRPVASLVKLPELLLGIAFADHQGVDLQIQRVEEGCRQQLPAVGEQALQALGGEHFFRPPADREPEDQGIDGKVAQLQRHQGPDAEAEIDHRDAQRAGEQRPSKGREEKALELHGLGHVGQLHIIEAGDHHQQAQHPEDRHIALLLIEHRDPRRREKQPQIQQQAEAEVEEKHRREVQIVRILLLDQGVGHAAVGKHLQDVDDRQHHGDLAGGAGAQLARENDAHHDVEQLRAETFKKTPEEVARDFASVTHPSAQSSYPRRFR